jgi:hypothetical protein
MILGSRGRHRPIWNEQRRYLLNSSIEFLNLSWYTLSKLNLGSMMLLLRSIRHILTVLVLVCLAVQGSGSSSSVEVSKSGLFSQAVSRVPQVSRLSPLTQVALQAASAPGKRLIQGIASERHQVWFALLRSELHINSDGGPLRGAVLRQRGRSPPTSL